MVEQLRRPEVLLVGGRSGVGKSTVAAALHELLAAAEVRHVVIEGDTLDLAWPAPHLEHPEARLAERNLAAVWANARALGHHRPVFTNSVSVLGAPRLAAAIGDDPIVTAVLLRAADDVVRDRLARRAGGSAPPADVRRSSATARRLDSAVTDHVERVDTDGSAPVEIARRLGLLTGWLG
ncbi:AAA family ATPase [Curtobacterium sp. MCBD17_008]|uniref:AAA family ATPase n=1 Tax=Curtobacterium sp. MCBD17_008 TaxID=2175656 RepID=UPI0021ABC712|nr:AAA family ATPase [Curtobacterium sp. MCBD17_008]